MISIQKSPFHIIYLNKFTDKLLLMLIGFLNITAKRLTNSLLRVKQFL